jgi:adenylate cyclase
MGVPMIEERAKRKLSGILSADAVGYSRLMQEDEASTIRNLEDSKRLMSELIEQFKGRVVDAPGDNLLAEFGSVVDATECAVKIQKGLKTKNADQPNSQKMEFRIGVNLGDVVEEADRIYGDGVNIAARIEGLAEPGGICISRTAYDHVKNKLKLGYEYLGEHSVKNITEPVRVYRVLMEPEAAGKVIGEKRFIGRISRRASISAIIALIIVAGGLIGWNIYLHQSKIEPASLDKMAYPLPDKPSIAVLPFENLSGNPEQEYIADGFSENIITALSKLPGIFVIARTSSFSYKGKQVKISQVAEELGVQYVLEGSFQQSGEQIRVTAQLIDALTGRHLWAEHYDRLFKEIFKLQDDIILKILQSLRIKLVIGEKTSLVDDTTHNLKAYLTLLKTREYAKLQNKEGNEEVRKLSKEAIALDPDYAHAYWWLAYADVMDVWFGGSKSPKESLLNAIKLLQKSIDMNKSFGHAYALLGHIYLLMRQYEKAILAGEKAVELAPNSNSCLNWLAMSLRFIGNSEEAIPLIQKAIRRSPFDQSFYLLQLGAAYVDVGHYEDAIKAIKKMLQYAPDSIFGYIVITVSYIFLNEEDKAREAAGEVLRINPNFSVERYAKTLPYKDKARIARSIEALRKAGLK